MRIISISFCLLAMSMVAVRADPEVVAPDANQQAPLVASDLSQAEALEKFQQGLDSLSELDFRLAFVTSLENFSQPLTPAEKAEFGSEGVVDVACGNQKGALKAIVDTVRSAVSVVGILPIGSTIVGFIMPILDKLSALADGDTGLLAPYLSGVAFAFQALQIMLSVISFSPLNDSVGPILKTLLSLKPTIEGTLKCFFGNSALTSFSVLDAKTKLEYHCGPTADLYRLVIADAMKSSPSVDTVAKDSTADTVRLINGSLAVLDLMNQHSIAEVNSQLLEIRPIFAADLLDQYREELSTRTETKTFADSNLVLAVGTTNALEACLRIEADPQGASEELDAEIEADEYEDEAYEDEDEEGQDVQGEEEEEQVVQQQ